MVYFECYYGRIFLVSAEHDSDLVQFITKFSVEKKIKAATFTAIGALKSVKLAFYDQKRHKYQEISNDSPHELASCVGNVSLRDGKPFVHMHAVLSDAKGNTMAGHVLEAIVFASEVLLQELTGTKIERKFDEITHLSLWRK